MALQELLNQYEILWEGGSGPAPPSTGSPFNWKVYIGLNTVVSVWFVAGIVPPTPPTPPVVVVPPTWGSLALPSFTTLGIVTFLSGPVSLAVMFPTLGIQGKSTNELIFCTHESNGANDIVYIGDRTLTSEANSAVSLKGPNQIFRFSNRAGNNTIPIGNISLASSSLTAQCRISALTS